MLRSAILTILLASSLGFGLTGNAMANSCGAGARALVSSIPGATLLSVNQRKNGNGGTVCVARIKIASKNGQPPRVVVRRFRP